MTNWHIGSWPLAAIFSLGLLAGCMPPDGGTDGDHTTQSAVDWDGRYSGTLPCASCSGIQTDLTINEAGYFTLRETYLGSKGDSFSSEGQFDWDVDGSRITFRGKDKRTWFVGEDRVWLIGADGRRDDLYMLTKQDEFVGEGTQMYVDPDSVTSFPTKGAARVRFDAIMNFQFRMEGGHKSLKTEMELNCTKDQVDMPVVTYFKDHDGAGMMLGHDADNAGNWLPISKSDQNVVRQAAEAYCP